MMVVVQLNGIERGPLTQIDLRMMQKRGEISAQTPAKAATDQAWQTLADFFPDMFTSASQPIAEIPQQPDAFDKLKAMIRPLVAQMKNRFGANARLTSGFYSHRAITCLVQRLRLDRLNGMHLNAEGEDYIAKVAAYIAYIAISNWKRRNVKIEGYVEYTPGGQQNRIVFSAIRERNGAQERYTHDFLRDLREHLLYPPKMFPYTRARVYALESLTLPSPEYLYLFGVAFMDSPYAEGNWPQGPKVGCLEDDFNDARTLLVDDLHKDCGLPLDHKGFRELSWWVVFPPYGWDMNDANDYNFMTFCSQVSEQRVVSDAEAKTYLRALLKCQGMEIRNFAARCLMIYRIPPQNAVEATHYQQALSFRDHPQARYSMAKYQHQIENVELNDAWYAEVDQERQQWLKEQPPLLSHRTIAETDPLYIDMEKNPPASLDEGVAKLEALMAQYPEDWVLKVLHAHQLLQGIDPERGEAIMKALVETPPDCFEGHSRYGTWLKYIGGRREEAFAVYENALKRWPWCQQASDACIWMITDGMTY